MLVWSEIPVYQVDTEELAKRSVRDAAVKVLQGNVIANRDHPSILLWSIGNELSARPGPVQASYIARAALRRSARSDAAGRLGVRSLSDRRLPEGVRPARRRRRQRLLRLVPGRERRDRGPRPALSVPRRAARLLPGEGADDQRVRGRGQPRRARRGERNVRLPERLRQLPPRRVRDQAVAVGAIYWALQEFRVRPGWDGGNPRAQPPIHQKGIITLRRRAQAGVRRPAAAFSATTSSASPRARRRWRRPPAPLVARPPAQRAPSPRYPDRPLMADKTTSLTVTPRDPAGSRTARRLRHEGPCRASSTAAAVSRCRSRRRARAAPRAARGGRRPRRADRRQVHAGGAQGRPASPASRRDDARRLLRVDLTKKIQIRRGDRARRGRRRARHQGGRHPRPADPRGQHRGASDGHPRVDPDRRLRAEHRRQLTLAAASVPTGSLSSTMSKSSSRRCSPRASRPRTRRKRHRGGDGGRRRGRGRRGSRRRSRRRAAGDE